MKLYADYTVIYALAVSPYDTLKLVQNKLDEFTVWFYENKLSINTGKTLLNNDRVHFVNEYTYLGAQLDILLDFESQAKATLKIVSHKTVILSRIRDICQMIKQLLFTKLKCSLTLIMQIFFALGHIQC